MTKIHDISFRLGIDLGGTKTEIAAFDFSGIEIYRKRVLTPQHDYDANIRSIRDLVIEIEQKFGKNYTIGIGIPGCISQKTGLIKGANSTWLIGKALDKDLANAIGKPVRLANDANCFALSEMMALTERVDEIEGPYEDIQSVFGVILGTGVGGGLVLNGQAIHGANGIAGEWGHNPLPEREIDSLPAPDCYCGRSGCIETYLSGPAVTQQYKNLTGKTAQATEIADLADQGDVPALKIITLYETRLARALGSIINVYDPQVIVLGGGLSKINRLYRTIPEQWGQYVFSDFVETQLLPPHHGDSSGIRGAAWLWPQNT
ncbi:ROK family protein [Curvivirga sp.]|uniref:ROK family protein n=1 Tax=Curvivirga sp. TaxID=2856848 RepID=UPI003B5C79FF